MSDYERNALLDEIEGDLAAIDGALARLDAGTYFSCERCGADLDATLLEANPTATRCPSCTTDSASAY